MEKLLSEENEWDELVDADQMEKPELEILEDEVRKAIRKMKNDKAVWLFKQFESRGRNYVKSFTELWNTIVRAGKVSDDWTSSTIVTNGYRQKVIYNTPL